MVMIQGLNSLMLMRIEVTIQPRNAVMINEPGQSRYVP